MDDEKNEKRLSMVSAKGVDKYFFQYVVAFSGD